MSPKSLPAAARPYATYLVVGLLVILLLSARAVAGFIIEYQWWKELDQVPTWVDMLLYNVSPVVSAALVVFLILWAAHARGARFAGVRPRDYPLYARLSTVALLLLAVVITMVTIESWTVVRYFGGLKLPEAAGAWHDPVFGKPLAFYLFRLPFYSLLLKLLLVVSLLAVLIYWLTARGWQLRARLPELTEGVELDLSDLKLAGGLESRFLRGAGCLFLLGMAVRYFLGRYEMVYDDHGFLVGIDYVSLWIGIPLQWLSVAAALIATILVWVGRLKLAACMAVAILLQIAVPRLVSVVYVRPNEISLQRPFIVQSIEATRAAFGLSQRTNEVDFAAQLEAPVDQSRHQPLLDNVRLWDWRAFHDTVTQIQALRPYYLFADSDVDRYMIDGRLRQVLLTPRELDIRQVSEARTRWINSHFIYTHGYGMVMAHASRITTEGLPVLFIQDAPPKIATSSLKLTRPEIYYGEVVHEPVFVRTAQQEFNYPSGSDNVHSRYEGSGGFPVSSLAMRLAVAVHRGDWNVLLTGMLAPESRMMIRRKVKDRVEALAGFLKWDSDPYLVLTDEGRLVWIVDGYTTSHAHPFARGVRMEALGSFNYIRNAVKATVDAYDGDVKLYVFEPGDPIIQAYQRLFPKLLRPASAMPASLRAHARYPEAIFRAQAEIYRTYHMRDPESFYNKEDLWDIAKNIHGQAGKPEELTPTYVVATLPGEEKPEFLLVLPFTPRNKDNLLGLMVARCDGPNLGELVFLQLSKQALIFGPMQVEARINQDQEISKDLSLWNQQGSQVLRGQMLVLPIENTFLYVEPIYIQASEARMPQLRKVVVAMGNTLIYKDTYEQALAALAGRPVSQPPPGTPAPAAAKAESAPPPQPAGPDPRLEAIRGHLQRYRDLSAQGRWAEAGKELEAIAAIAAKR